MQRPTQSKHINLCKIRDTPAVSHTAGGFLRGLCAFFHVMAFEMIGTLIPANDIYIVYTLINNVYHLQE